MNACFSEEERAALTDEIPAGRFECRRRFVLCSDACQKGNEYLTGQIHNIRRWLDLAIVFFSQILRINSENRYFQYFTSQVS